MPPAPGAVANRTPAWVRSQAAKVGVATAAYVERLLTGRDHIEQGVRSCRRHSAPGDPLPGEPTGGRLRAGDGSGCQLVGVC